MIGRRLTLVGGLFAFAACAPSPSADNNGSASTPPVENHQVASVACSPSTNMPVAGRASPYDSTAVALGDARALVCYGRPSMRGRTVFGSLVPYDELWRTGANEPTIIHLPVAATIAGIAVEPGSYSLYTIPGRTEWTVIVNRSTEQWGIENQYNDAIRAQEVGRATVASEATESPVETFVIRSEPQGAGANVVLEWENARIRIPVQRS